MIYEKDDLQKRTVPKFAGRCGSIIIATEFILNEGINYLKFYFNRLYLYYNQYFYNNIRTIYKYNGL